MTKALDSRTIFITGSGGVLGTTYVRNMLRAGARVVATDLVGARIVCHFARNRLNSVRQSSPDPHNATTCCWIIEVL